jgi:hypothetical protein
MRANLRRRIDRLARQRGLGAGRVIVLSLDAARRDDEALVVTALAEAGIERTEHDLVVTVMRFGRDPSHPPCALLSATARPHGSYRKR